MLMFIRDILMWDIRLRKHAREEQEPEQEQRCIFLSLSTENLLEIERLKLFKSPNNQ